MFFLVFQSEESNKNLRNTYNKTKKKEQTIGEIRKCWKLQGIAKVLSLSFIKLNYSTVA